MQKIPQRLNTNMIDQTDYFYALLTEGKLDLMHIPSGAVAWLWQYHRPQGQVDAAAQFGATAHHMDDPVIDAGLLRADQNVLVLHTQSGLRVSIYPDGGMGANGEVIDPATLDAFFAGGIEPEIGEIDPLPDDLANVPTPL